MKEDSHPKEWYDDNGHRIDPYTFRPIFDPDCTYCVSREQEKLKSVARKENKKNPKQT